MPLLLGSANPARILPLAGQMNAMASPSGFSSFERIATFSLEYGRRTAFGSVFAVPSPRPCCGAESRGLASTRPAPRAGRSEEHTSELQSQSNIVCRLLLEKKKNTSVKDNVGLKM